MKEVFAEYIVKGKTTASSILLRILAAAMIVISVISFLFLGFYAFTIVILVVYLAWYIFTITDIEYEYSLVNGELTIEKIMGQRKRKRVAEYDFKRAEIITYAGSEHLANYNGQVKVEDYSSYMKNVKKVAVIFNDKGSTTQLIFEPNEKIMEALKQMRPGIFRLDQ